MLTLHGFSQCLQIELLGKRWEGKMDRKRKEMSTPNLCIRVAFYLNMQGTLYLILKLLLDKIKNTFVLTKLYTD